MPDNIIIVGVLRFLFHPSSYCAAILVTSFHILNVDINVRDKPIANKLAYIPNNDTQKIALSGWNWY